MDGAGLPGYQLTSVEGGESPEVPPGIGGTELLERLPGATFEGGLYRLHNRSSAAALRPTVEEAFPGHRGRIWLFGFDWLGRQFAVDVSRRRGAEPLVLLLDPGAGEALEIPTTFSEFHEEELVHAGEAALARSFFEEWQLKAPKPSLAHSECVGYKVPLFLSGKDAVDNLEIIDLEVYWGLCAQLIQRTAGRADGTRIDGVSIERGP